MKQFRQRNCFIYIFSLILMIFPSSNFINHFICFLETHYVCARYFRKLYTKKPIDNNSISVRIIIYRRHCHMICEFIRILGGCL